MNTSTFRAALACAALLLIASAAHAQNLPTGTWTGTVTPPSGEVIDVTYAVEKADAVLAITMNVPAMGRDFPFADIIVEGGTLFFTWSPGEDLECTLEKQDDDSYTGQCVDDGGSPGTLVMVPPVAETPKG